MEWERVSSVSKRLTELVPGVHCLVKLAPQSVRRQVWWMAERIRSGFAIGFCVIDKFEAVPHAF
jgi:hypothetical protein